jgi:uncharacterized protein YhfF
MTNTEKIQTFWQTYLDQLPDKAEKPTSYEAWSFGATEEMANELAELVRRGTKTATAGLLWSYEAENESIPKPGLLNIITDWDGNPLCIIETTTIEIMPFNQVPAEFAYDEGEGNRSLHYWREGHWKFFSMECEEIGKTPSEDMLVVCERFKLVYNPK